MTIQIELWALLTFLVGLLITFLGAGIKGGKILLGQVEKRLDERFEALENAREQSSRHWDERFAAVIEQNRREAEGWTALEREFLRFQADLPLQYVRREDYVRGQSVIEAKLDALYNKLEVVQMKGANKG